MKERHKQPALSGRELVAANVRELRTAMGLSQEGLAAAAGFHRTYVSQLERCATNVSVDNLDKLAVALNVHVRDLFVATGR